MLLIHGELAGVEQENFTTKAGVKGSKVVGSVISKQDGRANVYRIAFDQEVSMEAAAAHVGKMCNISIKAIAKTSQNGRAWIEMWGAKVLKSEAGK